MSLSRSKAPAEFEGPTRFSDLLIEKALVSRSALERAARVQRRLEQHMPMGEVLVGLKYITRTQLNDLLREYRRRIRIGDLLVESGILTQNQLDQALEKQKDLPGVPLGKVLVDMKFLSERKFLKALCEQKDAPFIEPNVEMLDKKLMKRVPVKYLRDYIMFPLSMDENGNLTLVVNQFPTDEQVRMLEELFSCPIVFAIAAQDSIESVLQEYSDRTTGNGSVSSQTEEERLVQMVDHFIREAVRMRASDIHFEPMPHRLRIRYRIDGVLMHRTDLPKEMQLKVLSRLKILAGADIAERRRHQDGRFQIVTERQEVDIRMSSYVTVNGENIVLRILNRQVGLFALEELGMPRRMAAEYMDFVLKAPAGVVVITGPTGSGKTTTLYSSIDYCNNIGVKIITAEDPVEYMIEGIMQCSINPKIDLTFEDTLRAMVRQDPDIVVLGEIRDASSAQTAIQAALTGHKVYTTFHTEDGVGALLRLMNMNIETFLISSTVIGVLAQRLARRICPHCREETSVDPKEAHLLGLAPDSLRNYRVYRGRGCPECHYIGYSGRVGLYELLILNEEIKDAVLQQKPSYQIRDISMNTTGMVSMKECGIVRAIQGVTTLEEVLNKAPRSLKPRPIPELLEYLGEDAETRET